MTDLASWEPRAIPEPERLGGRFASLVRFDADLHAKALFGALCGHENADLWRYIPAPMPETPDQFSAFVAGANRSPKYNWRTMVIRATEGHEVLGMASYMRIRPEHGSAEVGCVMFSPKLQRTPIATEAMYLMAQHVFDSLGYRRYEWKCHNENAASKRAADRYGFTFEGIFRNDLVVRGENRDTAWYAITDKEWPERAAAFKSWLSPENFDDRGVQKKKLEAFRHSA